MNGTMVVGDRRGHQSQWAYPEDTNIKRYDELEPLESSHRPKGSDLFPLTRVSTQVAGLGKIAHLGFISPKGMASGTLIAVGTIGIGLTGLASYAAFDALARTPKTLLKVGLIAGGVAGALGFLQSLAFIVGGIGLAFLPEVPVPAPAPTPIKGE